MRNLRRLLQIVTLVGTLVVGVVAVALIVSQTPWFRDWLRRYIVRESAQYLNGQLSIGSLGGNLFFGVQLSDVALDVSGERVVAVKDLELDYSVFRLVSSGMVMDDIKLHQPRLRIERDGEGWNLARLVKAQRKEADREGPARPLSLPSIQITDGTVTIADGAVGTSGYRLPEQIQNLDVRGAYEYAPVHYTVTLDHLSFDADSPDLSVGRLAGTIAVRDDNLYVEALRIDTAETSLKIDGVVEQYLRTPVIKLTTTGTVSMPELGRVVPALAEYGLHPVIDVKADGPAERLSLDLAVRSEAGNITGQVTADVQGPAMGVTGEVDVERLNLAPLLKDPAQQSDITGRARLDLDIAGTPAGAPVTDRLNGSFVFTGPRVVAAGYDAHDVRVRGRIDGPRIDLNGRAAAYGGSATAEGFIVTPSGQRPLAFDLRGSADDLDLKKLPVSAGAPKVTTDLSVAHYHVRRAGQTLEGDVRLNRSTLEGATIGDGTVATFSVQPRAISYSATGTVADLDLERVGRAFQVAAIARPEYASRVNGSFEVKGSVPRRPAGRREHDTLIAEMTLDASGRLKDSEIMGGRLPELAFETQIANGGLKGRADGSFENFDPARIASRPELKGGVTGTVNASFAVADLDAPMSPDAITADGKATLTRSTVGGLRIETANIDAAYASQIGEVRQFMLSGPDIKAEASGRIALDQASASNLKYRVDAVNIPELAKLAGQEGIGGTATLEGTITGNRTALTATGTLDGSNLSYLENSALDLNSKYTVTVPELQFARARVEAATEGTFIKAGAFEISELKATTTYDDKTVQFTTNIKEKTRELDATGSVILHPDHQEIHLPQLAMRTAGVEWQVKPGTEAAVRYGRDRIELDNVQLVSTGQFLSVDGTIAVKGEAPTAALDVTAQNVDLDQLETLLLLDRGFSGKLNANAKVTGTMTAPSVDGHVEIHDGAFQTYKYQSLIADVDYVGGRVTVDATLTQTPAETITVKGTAPTSLFRRSEGAEHVAAAAGEEVDLHIKSTALGLGIVQGFTNQVANVTGTVEADVRITGSGDDPHLQGHIDLRNGAFGIPLGGVSYTGLNTRIDLTPDLAKITSFQILDEHGESLNVSGELAVHEKAVGAVNIRLDSDNFEIIDNELGDVGVDSSLRITGELRRPKVEGQVRVEAGRLEVDRILTLFYDPYATESMPEVVSAERMMEGSGSAEEATRRALQRAEVSAAPPDAGVKPAPEPPPPTGIFEAVELDVNAVMPDNLVLRGSDIRPGGPTGAALGDINITVGGDLHVRKQPKDQVRLVGTVHTVRGTYEFQGRRFELERDGQIRFVGETEINPFIDLRATRLIPNTGVEARIHITGTAQAPELELSSNPPLDESDILALIVFNRPVNELGTGERSSLAATAGGIATGFIAAPLGESIGRALDLDLFEITTTTESGELGAGVTLGQQIGDKAFIKLRQQFGERSVTEFMIEYQLARFLRLQATAAPETTGSANRINQRRVERAGIDLIFFFSY
ncbi:MAG TPA: translocation/assembly module TamB domain-containing protein [Vicinamibacterales bacterium]|nr:translocation/assembly module TamB domain-containing protein [Vicinamibacterales bacterium]